MPNGDERGSVEKLHECVARVQITAQLGTSCSAAKKFSRKLANIKSSELQTWIHDVSSLGFSRNDDEEEETSCSKDEGVQKFGEFRFI